MAFVKTAYAAMLTGAMLSGSVLAMADSAQAQTAGAASPVNLTSDARIERVEIDAAGKEKVTLYTPKDVVVVPGDKVVFTLEVVNKGAEPAAGFRATNPMPGAVQFISVREDWADVSVDGGANWGKLDALKVKAKAADSGAEIERAAASEDVTHVRWIFADAIAPGVKMTVSYRGVVK
ncbi:MAG: hypothetical protein ABI668_14650 [Sphingorhabdus sp.]